MKRAGGEIVSSFFLQIDIRADDVIDIDTILQPLQKIIELVDSRIRWRIRREFVVMPESSILVTSHSSLLIPAFKYAQRAARPQADHKAEPILCM